MSRPTQKLQPGEKVLSRIARGRQWQQISLTLLVDGAILLIVWALFQLLQRSFLDSYLWPARWLGPSRFIVINLFLSLAPGLIAAYLVYDFIRSFFLELTLTDRRVFGSLPGLFGIREVDFRLEEVETVRLWLHYLVIQRAGGQTLYCTGFDNAAGFVRMFTHRAGRSAHSEPLPA